VRAAARQQTFAIIVSELFKLSLDTLSRISGKSKPAEDTVTISRLRLATPWRASVRERRSPSMSATSPVAALSRGRIPASNEYSYFGIETEYERFVSYENTSFSLRARFQF